MPEKEPQQPTSVTGSSGTVYENIPSEPYNINEGDKLGPPVDNANEKEGTYYIHYEES